MSKFSNGQKKFFILQSFTLTCIFGKHIYKTDKNRILKGLQTYFRVTDKKNISYFNIYEYAVFYLFKFITTLFQFKNFSRISFCAGFLLTNTCYKFLANDSTLKMMKNASCFTLKAFFILKIFKFLS